MIVFAGQVEIDGVDEIRGHDEMMIFKRFDENETRMAGAISKGRHKSSLNIGFMIRKPFRKMPNRLLLGISSRAPIFDPDDSSSIKSLQQASWAQSFHVYEHSKVILPKSGTKSPRSGGVTLLRS